MYLWKDKIMMNKKIFVIEDDPDINRLLCRILQQGGYQVLPQVYDLCIYGRTRS